MELFQDILTKVTLPIIALVVLGYVMQSRLKLDIGTLNRLQVYVVMPAFFVHFLSSGKQPISVVWPVVYMGIVQFLMIIPVGWLLAMAFRMRRNLGPMMGLGAAYANVGFFGVPVTQLAFGSEYLIHQSVMAALMAIMTTTVGVWVMAPAGGRPFDKLKSAFETPMIPSIALGLGLRGFEVELPAVVGQPMQFLGSIFTPLALYTLGAQVAAVADRADRVGAAEPDPFPQVLGRSGADVVDLPCHGARSRGHGRDRGRGLDAGRRLDHHFRRRVQDGGRVHLDGRRDLDGTVATVRDRVDHRDAVGMRASVAVWKSASFSRRSLKADFQTQGHTKLMI